MTIDDKAQCQLPGREATNFSLVEINMLVLNIQISVLLFNSNHDNYYETDVLIVRNSFKMELLVGYEVAVEV
jgi:hypothetical protein